MTPLTEVALAAGRAMELGSALAVDFAGQRGEHASNVALHATARTLIRTFIIQLPPLSSILINVVSRKMVRLSPDRSRSGETICSNRDEGHGA